MKSQAIYQNNTDKELPKMIIASVLFHTGVVCLFTLKILFFPTENINYQAAIRVDLVSLPDKQADAAPATATTAPKPEPVEVTPLVKTQPKAVKDNTKIDLKKKQNKALEQLKALQSLEDEVKNSKDSPKKTRPIKGNVLAAGTAIKGLNKLDYDTYIGDIDSQIKSNWVLPEWLAKSGLRARALVKIDEHGYVVKKELILSSKNPTYDSLVMEAIDRSSPFPAPPEKFINLVGVDGIIFQFPN